jgi:4-hydroxy-tetrahydrodipicolinate synthase
MFWKRKAVEERSGFRGVWAASVTPHRREGFEANFAALLELVDLLGNGGVDGIVLLGATGEFPHIKADERQRMLHLAVKRSSVPIVVGVGHSTLDVSVQLAEAAVDSGAAGVLLMPPYFYRYRAGEILEFYRVFAVAVGGAIPILLYNIPAFTSPIPPEVARELLLSGEFAGIKDSSGDIDFFGQLAGLRRDHKFALLCGNDRIMVQARRAGADGVISGIACAAPELIVALNRAIDKRPERVELLNTRLQELIDWIERFPVPVGIAAAVEARGIAVGPPAIPLTSEQFDSLEEFKSWFPAWLTEVKRMSNV